MAYNTITINHRHCLELPQGYVCKIGRDEVVAGVENLLRDDATFTPSAVTLRLLPARESLLYFSTIPVTNEVLEGVTTKLMQFFEAHRKIVVAP